MVVHHSVLAASTTEIQVESQVLADASSTVAADEVVESLYSASGSGTSDVAAVDSYAAQGVCGNNACEEGETCSSAEDQSCCIADCPFLLQACPVPAGAKEQCGVGGTCNAVTGECTCYSDLGYAGTDCGECVFPYMSDGSGGCFNAQPAALSGTTGGSTTGGSTTGGSTTGGSTTGGSGNGGGGGMPSWALPAIIGGAVVVLVSAGLVYKFGFSKSSPRLRRGDSLRGNHRDMKSTELPMVRTVVVYAMRRRPALCRVVPGASSTLQHVCILTAMLWGRSCICRQAENTVFAHRGSVHTTHV